MHNRAEESFGRNYRLTRAAEYKRVFENNFRQADTCISILVGKSHGLVPRLGFAIAKKQVTNAIERNRLKRIFRESFRRNRYRLPPRDMVIMVRRPILKLDPALLRGSLENHWNAIIRKCRKS